MLPTPQPHPQFLSLVSSSVQEKTANAVVGDGERQQNRRLID